MGWSVPRTWLESARKKAKPQKGTADLERALDAIEGVLDLHTALQTRRDGRICSEDGQEYPCDTLRLLARVLSQ